VTDRPGVLALVDGVRTDCVPVSDSALLRGDGCFEAIRSYSGRLFALAEHLERLERSAGSLDIAMPDRDRLETWCSRIAADGGDGIVRVVLTRGDIVGETAPRCIVLHHRLPDRPPVLSLLPVTAPWHPAGRPWELSGVKTISYGPNLAAGRVARRSGYDDALLVSDESIVLEGPTFSVGWVRDGAFETPRLELGILESVTRGKVLELTRSICEVREVTALLDRVEQSDEMMAMSTLREVTPVTRLGDVDFELGPVTEALAGALAGYISGRLSSG